jgi:thiamine pyrophosphokinase
MEKCVIVGAGECSPQSLRELLKLNENDMCIAADGGLDYLLQAGISPQLVIGDMDSLSDSERLKPYDTRLYPPEKDDTDMLLAIKEGLNRGYKYFEIYGALGGRLDHTFANLQCMEYLINNGAKGRLIGDKGCLVVMLKGEDITFKATNHQKGQRISIFSYGREAHGVTIKGLKYTANNITLKSDFPIGVSNEFIGEDAYIKVNEGILMIYVD